jgi:hypothetical protein
MKKIVTLVLALLLTLSLLTACGDGGNNENNTPGNSVPINNENSSIPTSDSSGNSTPSTSTPSTSTPASTNPPVKRTIEVPDKPLDLTDDSIYFVVIDGTKINLKEATVQDFLNIGFVFNEDKDDEDYYDENSIVDANSSSGYGRNFGARLYKGGASAYIEVYAVNLTDRSLPLKDCEIGTVYFDAGIGAAFDISIVCNLSYGCTEEEIHSVFGDIGDDPFTETAYKRNQIRYYVEGHGEFWFIAKDTGSGAFLQIGVHTAKSPTR